MLDLTTFKGCRQEFKNVGAKLVDSDYRGEIKMVLFNHSAEDFTIQASDG